MKLSNKKALVTGASQGIGKAIALKLAEEGCFVGVHYLDDQVQAKKLVDQIREKGSQAMTFQADLMYTDQAIRLGNEAWDSLGGIDILINNAGISFKRHFFDTMESDLDAFVNVNYKNPYFLTQTVAKRMVENDKGGSIYSITSVNGIRPNHGQGVYGASKSAMETAMQAAALELAPHGISVNNFAIGAIETNLTAEARANPKYAHEVREGIPQGRFGLPEEIASVMVNLLISGSYMTGSTIVIDGGMLLMRGYGKSMKYKESEK